MPRRGGSVQPQKITECSSPRPSYSNVLKVEHRQGESRAGGSIFNDICSPPSYGVLSSNISYERPEPSESHPDSP